MGRSPSAEIVVSRRPCLCSMALLGNTGSRQLVLCGGNLVRTEVWAALCYNGRCSEVINRGSPL